MKKFIGFLFIVGLVGGTIIVRDPTILQKAIAQVETGPDLIVRIMQSQDLYLLAIQSRDERPVSITGIQVDNKPISKDVLETYCAMTSLFSKLLNGTNPNDANISEKTNPGQVTLALGDECKVLIGFATGSIPVKVEVQTNLGLASYRFK